MATKAKTKSTKAVFKKVSKKKGVNVAAILILLSLLAALVVAVFAAQGGSGIRRAGAWNCDLYRFKVTPSGAVFVENLSTYYEPGQTADVFINNVRVATLSVPELPPGTPLRYLGKVTVPSNGIFTWYVDGSLDCDDRGEHKGVCNYAEFIVE